MCVGCAYFCGVFLRHKKGHRAWKEINVATQNDLCQRQEHFNKQGCIIYNRETGWLVQEHKYNFLTQSMVEVCVWGQWYKCDLLSRVLQLFWLDLKIFCSEWWHIFSENVATHPGKHWFEWIAWSRTVNIRISPFHIEFLPRNVYVFSSSVRYLTWYICTLTITLDNIKNKIG